MQRLVHTTTQQGEVVTRMQLEREALLLSEIPGVNARVAMKTGMAEWVEEPLYLVVAQ
ncbi:hypothetical protein LRG41_003669 [Salmonella enterica]|nr:hypothetical protein [Salmonella enterica]